MTFYVIKKSTILEEGDFNKKFCIIVFYYLKGSIHEAIFLNINGTWGLPFFYDWTFLSTSEYCFNSKRNATRALRSTFNKTPKFFIDINIEYIGFNNLD